MGIHTTEARIMQSFSIFLLVAVFAQPVMSTNCTALVDLQTNCNDASNSKTDCMKVADKTEMCYKKLESIAAAPITECSIKNQTEALKAVNVGCSGIDTKQFEYIMGNISFPDAALIEAYLDPDIDLPTSVTLPPSWTLPAGRTLDPSWTRPPGFDGAIGDALGGGSDAAGDAEETAQNTVAEGENAANEAAGAVGDLAAAGITPVGYLPALLVAFLVAIQMMASQ